MTLKYIKSDLYRYTGSLTFKLFLRILFIIIRKKNTGLIFIRLPKLAMAYILAMVAHWW